MKHIVSVSEKFLIVSLRIFCLTSAVCNRLLGGELWAFGFRLTQFEICERLTTNSQSKNLLFVHKVTAFDDAVVGSSKHLKTAVSVDSAQVFRSIKLQESIFARSIMLIMPLLPCLHSLKGSFVSLIMTFIQSGQRNKPSDFE